MAGFRRFQVISGWFQVVSSGFRSFLVLAKSKERVSGKFNGELEAK